MKKWIAGYLQAGAAVMFYAAGAFPGDAILLLLPAAASSIAGLLLWGHGAQAPAAPREEPRTLDSRTERMEELLVSLQADVARLRDERSFLHDLYAGKPEQPQSLHERIGQ